MRTPRNLIRLAFVGIAPALIATAFMTEARAQMEFSDANVTVDLSVLEDGGFAAEPRDFPPITGFRRLLVPGSKFPVSTLHVRSAPETVSPGAWKKAEKRRLTKMTAPPARTVKEPKPPAMPKSVSAPPPLPPLKIAKTELKIPKVPPQPLPQKTAETELKIPKAPPPPLPQKIAKIELKIPKAPPPPAIPVEKVRTEPLKKTKPAVAKKIKELKKLLPLPPPSPPQKIAKTKPKILKTPPPPSAPPPPVAQAVTPKAAKAPKTRPDLQQQASLPAAASLLKLGKALYVEFKPTASKLPAKAKERLKALAEGLKKDRNLRLQLRAYAGGKSVSSSRARRLSLSRALSVRTFMIENGIRSTRIDVRALGNKTEDKPVNRVDVSITER
ncbi:MAG: OmpA family protein [Rhodospirillales bacterium]|jgi:outer membrane protein OmpA-like peptidoglycan-associated protein|nr:OmpA family protein [Rhodospirillales bacterium]MDP7098949.1 OmpA family protein [Rhodospirillales bacterium]MDP7216499.1 OmpA family protein [Rhodospirillales bacterium]HIJ43096.1 OmpA family protein [Rhodospirillaceae bacterium]HIJ92347.1 OmpA family protein [Rhodospirillaceae bacterium]